MNLQNNTILITGGSTGIGLALAKRFLALGNQVIVTGRNAQKLEQAKKENPALITFQGDVSDAEDRENLVREIHEHYPQLNILINNAAVNYRYYFEDEPDSVSKVEYELQVNLIAPIQLTVMLLPLLKEKPEAAVVNVSSGLALAPKSITAVYCCSKAGLHSFTMALRFQLAKTNVQVFEILPPLVDTPMTVGRGKNKMSPEGLVDEFLRNFKKNRFETYAGIVKVLKWILRIAPGFAYRTVEKRP